MGCEVDAALELKRKSNIDFTTCPLTYTHKKAQVNQGLEQGSAVAGRSPLSVQHTLPSLGVGPSEGGGKLWGPDMRSLSTLSHYLPIKFSLSFGPTLMTRGSFGTPRLGAPSISRRVVEEVLRRAEGKRMR